MQLPQICGVLFDLDGTLMDTAPDLVGALNSMLTAYDKPTIAYATARNYASQGSVGLIRLGFPEVTNKAERKSLQQEFLQTYADTICAKTTLFDEMQELLEYIEQQKIPWGIVTNKPAWLSEPLIEKFDLKHRAACLVSGDTLPKRKPHPDPLLHACKLINLLPNHCIYLGDDPRDVYAGNAAGMYTCIANYGYIEPDIDTDQWGADFTIQSPFEITKYIQLNNDLGT